MNEELMLKIKQLQIVKSNKDDTYKTYFQAQLTTNIETSDKEFQFISPGTIKFITNESTSQDFRSNDTESSFIPPKTGYYKISIKLIGTETFNVAIDPLTIYLIETNSDSIETRIPMIKMYKNSPNYEDETLHFDMNFMNEYSCETALKLNSTSSYTLLSAPNNIFSGFPQHISIDMIDDDNSETRSIDGRLRQILFISQFSKIIVEYIR